MSRSLLLGVACCAVALGGCRGRETADTAMLDSSAAATPASTALSLAQVAGQWNMRAVPETGDTTPTMFVLNATAESAGWTITFPNREAVPTRVIAIAGDSLVIETGPYQSARRSGVNATTRDVYRMVGDHLVGIAIARYATTGPDSVLRMRVEGIRVP